MSQHLPQSDLYLRLSTFSILSPDSTPEEHFQSSYGDFIRQGALDNLLRGKISFDEYLDVLEENQVDMDDYFEILEENLGVFE